MVPIEGARMVISVGDSAAKYTLSMFFDNGTEIAMFTVDDPEYSSPIAIPLPKVLQDNPDVFQEFLNDIEAMGYLFYLPNVLQH